MSLSVKQALLLCILAVGVIELVRVVATIPMLVAGIPLLPHDSRFWIAIVLGGIPLAVLRNDRVVPYLVGSLCIGGVLGGLLTLGNAFRCGTGDHRCTPIPQGVGLVPLVLVYALIAGVAGVLVFRITKKVNKSPLFRW